MLSNSEKYGKNLDGLEALSMKNNLNHYTQSALQKKNLNLGYHQKFKRFKRKDQMVFLLWLPYQ